MLADVRHIRIHWSFSKAEYVPSSLTQMPDETLEQRYHRKHVMPGEMLQPSEDLFPVTGRVCLSDFVRDLLAGGYCVVQMGWKYRISGRPGKPPYPFVYAIFLHQQFLDNSATGVKPGLVAAQLEPLTSNVLWRVRSYINFRAEDQPAVRCSFNCEAREPLFDCHGNRRTERLDQRRNSEGKKTGALTPIQSNATLRLVDRRFALLP